MYIRDHNLLTRRRKQDITITSMIESISMELRVGYIHRSDEIWKSTAYACGEIKTHMNLHISIFDSASRTHWRMKGLPSSSL